MKLYFELLKSPVFSMDDVNKYYNNIESARSAVKRLMNAGMVVKIRNNMYTCMDSETGVPLANRFQIASKITTSSYVSHHTAMEYYGITDKVYRDVYVASLSIFREFKFNGYTYVYVPVKDMEGVESVPDSGGIRVSDMERTLVDSVKDMDRIGGAEDVVHDIEHMKGLQEKRILKYMESMSNQFLYQKIGYLLSAQKKEMNISEDFFDECKSRIGKSKRYLVRKMTGGSYDNDWKLVVPENISGTQKGVILYNTSLKNFYGGVIKDALTRLLRINFGKSKHKRLTYMGEE